MSPGRKRNKRTAKSVTSNRRKGRADWQPDVDRSVAEYNAWYMAAAQEILDRARKEAEILVERAMKSTKGLREISAEALAKQPNALYVLRQGLLPPLARDRFTELSGSRKTLVRRMEIENKLGRRTESVDRELETIAAFVKQNLDPALAPWVGEGRKSRAAELQRAKILVGERHGRAIFDSELRNAQEHRQQAVMRGFLTGLGFKERDKPALQLKAGEFAFGRKLVGLDDNGQDQNLPTDCVVRPMKQRAPLLAIELKSAGDFTNVNKRRKEEANKHAALTRAHGKKVLMLLQLFGYFDHKYLAFEGGAGIDWAWDHRLEDFRPYLGV